MAKILEDQSMEQQTRAGEAQETSQSVVCLSQGGGQGDRSSHGFQIVFPVFLVPAIFLSGHTHIHT